MSDKETQVCKCECHHYRHLNCISCGKKEGENTCNFSPIEKPIAMCSHYTKPEGGCGCECHKSCHRPTELKCTKCLSVEKPIECEHKETEPESYRNKILKCKECGISLIAKIKEKLDK